MRGRQHDARHPIPACLDQVGPMNHPPAAIAPRRRLLVEPAPIRQAADKGKVRSPAALAPALRAFEANAPAQLAPVRRIERSQLAADWHGYGAGRSAAA